MNATNAIAVWKKYDEAMMQVNMSETMKLPGGHPESDMNACVECHDHHVGR